MFSRKSQNIPNNLTISNLFEMMTVNDNTLKCSCESSSIELYNQLLNMRTKLTVFDKKPIEILLKCVQEDRHEMSNSHTVSQLVFISPTS